MPAPFLGMTLARILGHAETVCFCFLPKQNPDDALNGRGSRILVHVEKQCRGIAKQVFGRGDGDRLCRCTTGDKRAIRAEWIASKYAVIQPQSQSREPQPSRCIHMPAQRAFIFERPS